MERGYSGAMVPEPKIVRVMTLGSPLPGSVRGSGRQPHLIGAGAGAVLYAVADDVAVDGVL